MNYNNNKNENIAIDDMKIKSNLDASLDLSGISVSEDLINRTLAAIKKQEAEQQILDESNANKEEAAKKVIPWNRYIRALAGVAAAAIIVVAGYGLANTGSKKSAENTTDLTAADQTYDTVTEEKEAAEERILTATSEAGVANGTAAYEDSTATSDTNMAAADINKDVTTSDQNVGAVEVPQFTITADTNTKADTNTEADTGEGTNGYAGDTMVGATAAITLGEQPVEKTAYSVTKLTFRDIFLPDPTQAEYITITDEVNSNAVTLTTQEEILDFYSVMDQHLFTQATEESSEQNYTVELKSQPDEALYTMTIGNHVIVIYNGTETTNQSLYDAADMELLKQNLLDLYQKYSK